MSQVQTVRSGTTTQAGRAGSSRASAPGVSSLVRLVLGVHFALLGVNDLGDVAGQSALSASTPTTTHARHVASTTLRPPHPVRGIALELEHHVPLLAVLAAGFGTSRLDTEGRDRNAVLVQNLEQDLVVLLAHHIKVKDVAQNRVQLVLGELLHVLDEVHEFTERVRVVDESFVESRAQVAKGKDELLERFLRELGSRLGQEGELRVDVRVLNGVGGKDVADSREEIVAQERVAGPVGQKDEPKVRVNDNVPVVGSARDDLRRRPDLAAVGQGHLASLGKRLEDRGDVNRCLVGFVDDQHSASFDGANQRRVLVDDDALLDRRLNHQRLDRRVAVQLDVLARPVDQLQEPVREPVFADTLVANQNQVLAEGEIGDGLAHDEGVEVVVKKGGFDAGHQSCALRVRLGRVKERHLDVADDQEVALDLGRRHAAVHLPRPDANLGVVEQLGESDPGQLGQEGRQQSAVDGAMQILFGVFGNTAQDADELPGPEVSGLVEHAASGLGSVAGSLGDVAELVGKVQDLDNGFHRRVDGHEPLDDHFLLGPVRAGNVDERKQPANLLGHPGQTVRDVARLRGMERVARRCNDAEAGVNGQDPLVPDKLLVRQAGKLADVGEAAFRDERGSVGKGKLAVLDQPSNRGQRAGFEVVNAFEDTELPYEGGNNQTRVFPDHEDKRCLTSAKRSRRTKPSPSQKPTSKWNHRASSLSSAANPSPSCPCNSPPFR